MSAECAIANSSLSRSLMQRRLEHSGNFFFSEEKSWKAHSATLLCTPFLRLQRFEYIKYTSTTKIPISCLYDVCMMSVCVLCIQAIFL